ncbi:cation-transporting ATPase E [Thermocatellispora tengchongensis]|uniref:Cation-transporting ATPase E n=1 Tax=Thermocatellispora tengchongensis TaxID=1073253 RepID=A0A840PIV7_9ACTN|nr:HAD-IC family P-type ATPase [Thermocatellispora tengchongensis]MBB5139468.1 cation-transporting ATPase E [Thermocatellispora tengchongensis]
MGGDTAELTGVRDGLTSAEVAERVAAGQVNIVPRRSSRSLSAIVRANVLTLFNGVIGVLWALILIFGEWQDSVFGLVIVANTAIGVVQELRAKRTLDRLAVVNEAPVRVRRDGAEREIPPRQVVLGDLVLLGPGDRLLVDGAVTASDGLEVDESLLTGEADPVHKQPGDEVLSGSFVVAGTGCYTATRVGTDAYAAKLAEEASAFSLARSELREGITRFIKYITWAVVPIGALLTYSQLTRDSSFAEAITGTVAGVVTMIPEGLVLMTSIAFAVGVVRLGRRRCLVQELPAIEGLARVDVLCLDKTGTLTAGGMDLDQVIPVGEPGLPVDRALAALAACDPRPNPTALAIRAGYGDDPGWRVRFGVPFSSARKWSGARFEEHGAWILGAPDVLLPPGTPAYERAGELAATGLRVLVLCRVPDGALDAPDALTGGEGSPQAAALVVLRQRIRPDARETLRYFAEQNVTIKVISGDNPESVKAIATSLGIPGGEHAVDARTLPEDDPDKLAEILDRTTVFGRVTPRQKRLFVSALQSRGHTVAMTGDGVNDVLALKDADLGVAMGSGSGATKAVAQVVLLDDRFATLPHVVAEGRRVLANIERVSNLFLTKTFYAIVLSLLTGVAGLAFPFAPRHSTLVNALTIGIPAFFLALAPSLERSRPGFVPRVLRFAVPAGVICALAMFASFTLAHTGTSSLDQDRTAAVITLFLASWWVLVLIAMPLTWWRVVLVAAMAGLFAVALAVPASRELFALRPEDLSNDLVAVGFGALAAVALSAAIAYVRRRARKAESGCAQPIP